MENSIERTLRIGCIASICLVALGLLIDSHNPWFCVPGIAFGILYLLFLCKPFLLLVIALLSCEREQPGFEPVCKAIVELPSPVKAISLDVDSFPFAQPKVAPDFSLSVFTDRSMTFSQAVVQVKRIADEYRRAGLIVTVPEATIFKIDTLPKWRSSSEALSFFYAFRQGVETKGTFSIYLTAGNMGGIAYVIGRRKNIAPKADVAVIFCTNFVKEYDTFTGVHEVGHLCGSLHTHDCVWNGNNTSIDECVKVCAGLNEPGSVMSYCFDAWKNIYFHPQCLDAIKANIHDISR